MTVHKGPLDKKLLTQLYSEQNLTMQQIGDRLGRCAPNVLYWMRKHGIPSRPSSHPGNWAKHQRNEDFFKSWSPEMAWVLGLMFADGNIGKAKDGLVCTLSSIDKDLLEQVATLIETDAPIAKWRNRSAHVLRVGNTLVGRDLVALGCVPCKSRIMQFPKVPVSYLSHFVRGLWDGDGCVFVRDRKRKGAKKSYREVACSYVSGSQGFVASLRDVILAHTSLAADVKKRQAQYSPFYVISYYHRNSLRLLPWIYQNSTQKTRLARKYSVVKELGISS